ncbi:5957_t:CDS:2 [Gigaspora margarita]|uniref:5957_t:CDS:1 n=1 Tax=Gigaspora margarita TaxID=4874 RepID=A0ABM8W133_GIGMA|nr:5957_t:CDS:2 [Gigaspora margarita]
MDDGKHQCNLCPQRSQPITQKKETGYTNLMNHLEVKHKNFKSIYQQYLGNTTSPMISFNYDTSVRNIFDWVSLIVNWMLRQLTKYLNSLANIVRERIKNTLPEKIGIMFDGWMNNMVFTLLDCLNVDAHIKIFKDVLELYNKGVKNVLFLSEATNDLQNESMNLDDVRAYFDLLIGEHPYLECRLGKNASVIQDLSFKEIVVKVLRKQESVLTSSEKQKLQSFIVDQSMQPIENEPITMKNRVAKKNENLKNQDTWI